jgi:hypothetical protein
VNRLVEDEFLDREVFRSPAEFLAKANTYWSYFNLVRKTAAKNGKALLKSSPAGRRLSTAPCWTGSP